MTVAAPPFALEAKTEGGYESKMPLKPTIFDGGGGCPPEPDWSDTARIASSAWRITGQCKLYWGTLLLRAFRIAPASATCRRER